MTRVLLVDDHEMLREGLGTMIDSRDDLEVVGHAKDGHQALEMVESLHPDITVMDVWLPNMSGIDATAEIVKRDPNAKVIVLSVYEKRSVVERSLQAGAVGYVVKSASSKELFEAIDAVRQGKSYLSPTVTQSMLDWISSSNAERERESGIASLTNREREVLQCVAEGLGNKEIAKELNISSRTVESHRAKLMKKLGVHNASSLVRVAIREDLVAP
jgi:two-component system response regulator NreC